MGPERPGKLLPARKDGPARLAAISSGVTQDQPAGSQETSTQDQTAGTRAVLT